MDCFNGGGGGGKNKDKLNRNEKTKGKKAQRYGKNHIERRKKNLGKNEFKKLHIRKVDGRKLDIKENILFFALIAK